jgi:hypothetical protein
MQRKYADRGFAAVSVSLDDPKDAKERTKVEAFLRDKGAAFLNVQLDASQEDWSERLKIAGPPCVYVFNRDNQIVLKLNPEVDYKVIEKKVLQLLDQ